MAGRSRLGRMVLWWKSRKAMRERPFCPRGWLRLYKSGSMRSSLDTETNREREGGGHQNPKLAPWKKFKVGPNLGALERECWTSSLIDAVPGRVHLLYCPMFELWSWNVACVRRVKLRLPCGPAAVEEPILRRINGIEARVARA
jgi:hypothetical protein